LNMEHIIKAAVKRGASDLHVKAGDVFRARINGELRPLTKQRLTPEQTRSIALDLIPSDAVRNSIDSIRDYDCSWGAPGIGRFRVNILRQRSSFMIVMRVIPFDLPTIEKLELPQVVAKIAELDHGLVLVTGPTGSGKSSTIAALIHHINSRMNKHVITLESPIEFLHRDLNSSVTQREIGVDTESFGSGLQSALRQDPNVVVVEELLDQEMVDTALTAAETGRLVISSLHTPDATTTLARLVAMFAPHEREVARVRLADSLGGVISQRLLPRADGSGRRVAAEIVVRSPQIAEVIVDRNRSGEMYDVIADSHDEEGMQTFDQHLVELVRDKVVTFETAQAAATNKDEFGRLDTIANGKRDTERRTGMRSRRHGKRDRRRSQESSEESAGTGDEANTTESLKTQETSA
jgi:twitching motility protein PilT